MLVFEIMKEETSWTLILKENRISPEGLVSTEIRRATGFTSPGLARQQALAWKADNLGGLH